MKSLCLALAALPLLVSCTATSPVTTAAPPAPRHRSAESPFVGSAPPSVRWTPPDRYYAFGGGFTHSRRQTEGDEVNFLRYNPVCRKHYHCGYYNGGCGYSSCGYGYSYSPMGRCH